MDRFGSDTVLNEELARERRKVQPGPLSACAVCESLDAINHSGEMFDHFFAYLEAAGSNRGAEPRGGITSTETSLAPDLIQRQRYDAGRASAPSGVNICHDGMVWINQGHGQAICNLNAEGHALMVGKQRVASLMLTPAARGFRVDYVDPVNLAAGRELRVDTEAIFEDSLQERDRWFIECA